MLCGRANSNLGGRMLCGRANSNLGDSGATVAEVPGGGAGCSYRAEEWADCVIRGGVLPREGFYRLTYADGRKLVLPLMELLDWSRASVDESTEQQDHEAPTLHWCNSAAAKQLICQRQQRGISSLYFCSCLPNVICLHNKKLLHKTIRNYERLAVALGGNSGAPRHLRFPGDIRSLVSDSYLPQTLFDISEEELRHIAEKYFTDSSVWIAKPLTQNCGKGIVIIRDRDTLLQQAPRLQKIVIQKYIGNPLTLDGRKSDLRVYLLLVCPKRERLLAFYHPGFVRLAMRRYSADSSDVAVHLTNQSVAKATKEWRAHRDDSTWSPERLSAYLNRHRRRYRLAHNFVFEVLHPTIRSILGVASRAAYPKVSRCGGCFEILGCDFMLDTSGKVWLIEINCYPGMATSTRLLKALKPAVVQESVCVAMECIAKAHKGLPLLPLEAIKNFQMLWDSDNSQA